MREPTFPIAGREIIKVLKITFRDLARFVSLRILRILKERMIVVDPPRDTVVKNCTIKLLIESKTTARSNMFQPSRK